MKKHNPRQSLTVALSSLAIALAGIGAAQAAGVTDEDILKDAETTHQVVTHGLGTKGQRYSPLAKVNVDTVKDLVPVWAFSFGGEKQRGQQSQPLIYDGKMYVTGSYSRIYALDVKTGAKLWKYEHRLPEGIMPCCDVINRGAAIYGDLVIFGTLDAQLVALNKDTGKVVWREKVDDYKAGYSLTAAPQIVKGKIITGVSGGEFGVMGRVEARDARTGKMVWMRPVVEGHMGYTYDKDGNKVENGISGTTNATWPGDLWKTGGAATWQAAYYDPDVDLIFMGTGNPAPWNSWLRPGDNLYSSATVAIDPDTGKIAWHYQSTPHDGWDYDGVNEFVSFEYKDPKTGQVVKAGGKADRNGFFFVNDRSNGKLLNAFPFVTRIDWAKGIDLQTGRPLFDESKRPGNPFTEGGGAVEGGKGKVVFNAPSFLGGKNQMPMAFSPDTGLFYVPANEWGMDIWNEPVSYKRGAAYLGAGFTIKPLYEDYIGAMRAVDPVSGKIVWEVKNNAPLWGGVLTTGGNLVFYGTPEGYLKAVNAKTGDEVWQYQTGSGVIAPPVTWEMDGEQYVAVVSGWGGAVPLWGGDVAKRVNYLEQGGMVWVFKLHKS
ncbi:methanol/ethanol family PQQ-dependent dehydrogenase [Thauera sp. JM12B12]|uniref:methanol/ethanol family PQQ-dependent dehydrogenase n=1 Tax=Thauera sp. JM12B12 TaxID=3142262 RepID=UPI0031F46B68